MTIERKSFVSSIEPREDGVVQVRLGLQTVLDGRVVETLWHRTVIEPGSVEEQMALVNKDIAKLDTGPWPAVAYGIDALKAACGVLHTPAVVKSFKEKRSEDIKKIQEARAASSPAQ